MQINFLRSRWHVQRRRVVKTLLIMKLIAFFMLVACLHVSAEGSSQTITLSEKNVPLLKVFESIEKQTNFVFFFDTELLAKAKKVDVKFVNAPIDQVLKACF